MMPSDAWSLHSQLKKDTIDIGDLPLCKVLVIKDAHYPWLLLVPRREGAVEIIDLGHGDHEKQPVMTALQLVEVGHTAHITIAAAALAWRQRRVSVTGSVRHGGAGSEGPRQ